MSTKRIVAREWIIFLVSLIVGYLYVLLLFYLDGDKVYTWGNEIYVRTWFDRFWNETVGSGKLQNWLPFVIPYLLVQLVRSIVWSIKTIRKLN